MVKVIRLILDVELHADIEPPLQGGDWEATELGGKYSTRYRSAKVLELQRPLPVGQWTKQVAPERVLPRKQLRGRLGRCRTSN